MRRQYHRWYSPRLHRDMELLVFGHAGARMVVFPTSLGRFYEWENRGLIGGTLGQQIENGQLQVYCVDGVDEESWYATWKHPQDRGLRQTQYDLYVCDEVLPLSRSLNPNPYMIVSGASFGAYHAMNFALRHPETVGRVLAMSGIYDIINFADGYGAGDVYFNNPVAYLANENNPYRIAAMQRMNIIMVVGEHDRLRHTNERLSGLLWQKGVGNALRIWGGLAHDWPDWDSMLRLYMNGND